MKIELDGDFHDFCNGCHLISVFPTSYERERLPDGYYIETQVPSCKHYYLCGALYQRLQKRITGSIVEEDEG